MKIQDDQTTTWVIDDKPPTLEEAQAFIGGYVEMAPHRGDAQVLVNEEGLIHGLPVNPTASDLCGYPILGNALILKGDAKWD
jgi:hypothetical protein